MWASARGSFDPGHRHVQTGLPRPRGARGVCGCRTGRGRRRLVTWTAAVQHGGPCVRGVRSTSRRVSGHRTDRCVPFRCRLRAPAGISVITVGFHGCGFHDRCLREGEQVVTT